MIILFFLFVSAIFPLPAQESSSGLLIGAGEFTYINIDTIDGMYVVDEEAQIDEDADLYLPVWRIQVREDNRQLNLMADQTDSMNQYADPHFDLEPLDRAYQEYLNSRNQPDRNYQEVDALRLYGEARELLIRRLYQPAEEKLVTSAGIWKHLGEPHGLKLAECHILLAECHYHRRDFLLSLDTFWKALWLFRGLGLEDRTALPYRRIGDIFFFWGNYDKALKAYEWSLSVNRKAGSKEEAVRDRLYIAGIYRQWGLFTKSSELLQTALQEAEKLRGGVSADGLLIADVLTAMGDACVTGEDPQGALDHYRKAYDLIRGPEDAGRLQLLLHSIGRAYQASGNYQQAEKCYSESMRMTGYLQKPVERGLLKIDLGKLYRMTGDCERAFSLLRSTGFEREINAYEAEACDNLGNLFIEEEDYAPAVYYLTESVRIKEKLRLTASGKTRRDYLASQLHTYESLVAAHIRRGKPNEAFDASELARAKFLTEQISARSDGDETWFEGIHFFRNRLPHKCAVLSYANIRTGRLVFMEADKNGVNTLEMNIADYLREVTLRFPLAAEDGQEDRRGLTFDVSKEKSHEESFESIISYYRYLLTRPSGSRTEDTSSNASGSAISLHSPF